jgi:hypothetical protein
VSTVSDPVPGLIHDAFHATVEAEKYIYAGGATREQKDHIIAAHGHLLALKNLLPVKP